MTRNEYFRFHLLLKYPKTYKKKKKKNTCEEYKQKNRRTAILSFGCQINTPRHEFFFFTYLEKRNAFLNFNLLTRVKFLNVRRFGI